MILYFAPSILCSCVYYGRELLVSEEDPNCTYSAHEPSEWSEQLRPLAMLKSRNVETCLE